MARKGEGEGSKVAVGDDGEGQRTRISGEGNVS